MKAMDYVPSDFGRILMENDNFRTSCHTEMEETRATQYVQRDFPGNSTCTANAKSCVKRASLDSKVRRLRANDRERRRIQSINGAMEALRKAIPDTREKPKITKLQILRLAQRYIRTLTEILRTDSRMATITNENNFLEYHCNRADHSQHYCCTQ